MVRVLDAAKPPLCAAKTPYQAGERQRNSSFISPERVRLSMSRYVSGYEELSSPDGA